MTAGRRRAVNLGISTFDVLAMGTMDAEKPLAVARVMNRTLDAVEVYLIVDGEEQLVASLHGARRAFYAHVLFDSQWLYPDHCTRGALVARSPDGETVARLIEGLCPGDTWVLESHGASRIER
jgi:hypothetical protein